MRRAPLLLVILILCVVATGAASAELVVHTYTNDFSLTTPSLEPLKACSCEPARTTYTVVNTGNFPAEYAVTVQSEETFFTPSTSHFALAPGARHTFTVKADVPCAWTGTAATDVIVTSDYGRDRILSRELIVHECQNALLSVEGPEHASVLEPAVYDVRIRNVADFTDGFELTVTPGEQVTYDADRWARLAPDEERRIRATYTPRPGEEGETELRFTVTSGKNGQEQQATRTLGVHSAYEHELVVPTSAELCTRVPNEIPFTVRNVYGAENSYRVTTDGPRFAEELDEEFTLAGNEEANRTLRFTPMPGDEGADHLHVALTPAYGDRIEREIALETSDCYAFTAGIVSLPEATDTACCGERVYELNVRNEGHSEARYQIDVDAPSWFLPEERTIRLAPQENRNVKLYASIPCIDATHEFPITITNLDAGVTERFTFTLNSQTPQSCHAVTVEPQEVTITHETPVVSFIVRNDGSETGLYTPLIDARLYERVIDEPFLLAPGEEAVVHLETRGNLSAYERGTYLGTLAIAHSDALYEHAFWTELRPVAWYTNAWRAVTGFIGAATTCFWVTLVLALLTLLALLLLLLHFFGLSVKTRLTEHELFVVRTTLLVILFVLLVILGLLGMPDPAALHAAPGDHAGPVIEWYEGEAQVVNLSTYFTDPDDDTLTYTAIQPANIAVDIDGEIATLTPDRGFTGWERIVFTASDKSGGVTDSPFIGLSVLERKELSFFQWLQLHCLQTNLWLLALLTFLLLLVSIVRQPHSETIIIDPPRPPRRKRPVKKAARKVAAARTARARKPARKKTRKAARKSARKTAAKTTRRVAKKTAKKSANRPVKKARNASVTTRAAETVLVASQNGDKVHDPQCLLARRIPKQNRVGFSTKSSAVKKGYIPCRVCQPFD